ncbi:MAG: hypothetical protein WAV54_01355 [Acidimicrobiales bacterium]
MTGDLRRIGDYSSEETELLLGTAADLLRSFGSAFGGRHIAIVGGLVPTLLVPDPPQGIRAHPGTGDLDLHLSLHLLDGETADYYDSIVEGLGKLGLKHATENGRQLKWRWGGTFRGVRMVVEFLCPARTRGGVPESPARGTPAEQNVGPNEAICALGLQLGHLVPRDTITINRRVRTASGDVTYPFPVADVTSWLCLKSDAIVLRDKAKDAFDVTWVIDGIGPEMVAARIAASSLLRGDERDEVLAQLRQLTGDQFADLESVGPVQYATFHDDRDNPALRRHAQGSLAALRNALVLEGLLE